MIKNPKKQTIAVVINTLNAERIFDKCLDSVTWADEIIVCDMYSDDKTVEIAHKYGAKVYFHQRCNGCPEPARNFAGSKVTSDWTLVLDADELVSDSLRDYLLDFVKTAPDDVLALEIPRETFALGKKLKCMYQHKLRRFWRTGTCEWKGHVHNIPELIKEGRSVEVKHKKAGLAIQHYHIESIESYLEKTNRYTTLEMERFIDKKTKFSLFRLLVRPLFEFFKFYILKLGFTDGIEGFIICSMNANYKFIQLAKLYEMRHKEKNPDLIY